MNDREILLDLLENFRLFGISRGQGIGLPNLLGVFAPRPQQVGESDTSTTRNPRDPNFSKRIHRMLDGVSLPALGWLPAVKLLAYFDQAYEALYACLERMPSTALYKPAPGWPGQSQTSYACIRNFLMDSLGHMGEIRAIKAMWERQNKAA